MESMRTGTTSTKAPRPYCLCDLHVERSVLRLVSHVKEVTDALHAGV